MIYVITAVHNRIEITTRFVNSLISQSYEEEIQLILVDDGSTDGTDKKVKKLYKNTVVLYGDGRLFWGGALHKAYVYLMGKEISDEDIIFIVNDDDILEANFLKIAVDVLNRHPNDLLTGCGYGIKTGNYLDGPVDFNLKNGAVRHLPAGDSGNCASTRALFLKAKVYKELGGFHPILLPHYASDYEYTIRAYKKGHNIISDKELRYFFSEDTTGDNSHKKISLKKIMSKRSKLNPFYKLNFILMIAPVYRLPSYIAYQFGHFKHHDRDLGKEV